LRRSPQFIRALPYKKCNYQRHPGFVSLTLGNFAKWQFRQDYQLSLQGIC